MSCSGNGTKARVLSAGGLQLRREPSAGGTKGAERELGDHRRQTLHRLLEAGLAEFAGKGYCLVSVDDVVRRARTSHGTFYFYFTNKEDLFRTLLRDALGDMRVLAGEFPVLTVNGAGRPALARWVRKFCSLYARHAGVIRVLSQADTLGEDIWRDGLRLLFELAEAIAHGMTAAPATSRTHAAGGQPERAELTAIACLMMLEGMNSLLSVGVRLPMDEMVEQLTAVIYAAFRSSSTGEPGGRRS